MTNTNHTNTNGGADGDQGHLTPELPPELPSELPSELVAVASMLDRLAAKEAGRAGGSLADRIFVKTRSSVVHEGMTPEVRKVNDALRRSGTIEAALIPADLETRIFRATVDAIATPEPVAGRIGGGTRWLGRLALAAGVLLAVGGGVWMLSKGTTPTGGGDANPTPIAVEDTTPKDEIETILATSEAEESFAALFTLQEPGEVDPSEFGREVASLMKEAARVEEGLTLPSLGGASGAGAEVSGG
jgi:hypothetical protein